MATLQPNGLAPQLVRRASSDRSSRNSPHQIMPFRSSKHGKGNILVDTWITNLKEPPQSPMALKDDGAAPDDSPEPDTEPAAATEDRGFCRDVSSRIQPEVASPSYDVADRATLLRKFTVHATSSRQLQGLADLGLMILTLLPTVLLRLIRAAMGLLGITEHRWRGISMVVPLTLEDRSQLEVIVRNLVAGRLGRRPEPPLRGPVSPAQQLLLDTHAILAAAATTAAAFSLPYNGMPQAALQAKLSSYLRGVASADSVCTQDCLKRMRKMGRKTLTALCATAPRLPATAATASSSIGCCGIFAALRSGRSSAAARMVARPKPRTVAKAFMSACLLEQSRSQPHTLIQLVARFPDGSGDLVETMSLVPLAAGAEYLRLLGAAAGEPQRFADQIEAASEFGRLRPSDAKKDPAMQGLAINARVHCVGMVRYAALAGVAEAPKVAAAAAAGHALCRRVDATHLGRGLQERAAGQGQGEEDRSRRLSQQHEGPKEEVLEGGREDRIVQEAGPGVGEDDDIDDDDDDDDVCQRVNGANGGTAAATAAAPPPPSSRVKAASRRPQDDVTGGLRSAVWGSGNGDLGADGGSGCGIGVDDGDGGGGGGGIAASRSQRTLSGGSGGSSEGDDLDTRKLLQRTRKHNGTTSSQLELVELVESKHPAGSRKMLSLAFEMAAAVSKRAIGLRNPTPSKRAAAAAAAAYAAARTGSSGSGGGGQSLLQQHHHHVARPPSFTAASGPSTRVPLYPIAALDVFQAVYSCPRSGAFAVYGRTPRGVGLSRLVTAYSACHALPAAEQAALLGRLGYDSLDELREEVEQRKALCVAQALPVVIASLRLMCRSATCLRATHRTGSFLHVQQSLLSDLHRLERSFLEDTQGALDVLAERLVVRFVEGSEKVLPLHLSGSSSIVVSLPADCVEGAALAAAGLSRTTFCGATYGLTPLLFNMGINSLQSLGFLAWSWWSSGAEAPQDVLNKHSVERLNEYAVRAGQAGGPHLAALNQHYSTEGRRRPKDTAMFSLVRLACEEVGGGRAVNCKSGKDRTALEVSKTLAQEVVAAGLLPRSETTWLEGQFLRGLSYVSTSQNHGQPPAYAFNEMEIATLPPGWRPEWRLCGKVSS